MDVKLVVQKSGAPQAFHMRGPEMIIGRQKGCGVRIPSGMVSRQHCLLSIHDDLLRVEDLSSANGTLINGRRIMRREVLRPGDKLRVGPITFVIHYQLSQAALDRLVHEDEDQFEVVPVDDVEVVGEVNLVLEGDEPLPVDDLVLPPVVDPLDALAQIEAAGGGASPPAPPAPKKTKRKTTPGPRPAPPSPPIPFDDADDVEPAASPPKRVKFSKIEAPAAEDEPIAISPADEDEPEASPDASQILGTKNWQLPTGQDIRDILAQLEKGKKA
jgi:predicted component of type VI protein secretion system